MQWPDESFNVGDHQRDGGKSLTKKKTQGSNLKNSIEKAGAFHSLGGDEKKRPVSALGGTLRQIPGERGMREAN